MRHAVRLWRRQPVLALAAIVSLALGIGANTAIFSVLNAVVLRPLPFPDADRLVVVWETSPQNPARWVAPANFLDWQREARSWESLAAFDEFAVTMTSRGEAERLRAAGASGTFFTTLGVQATLGRTLLPTDDAPGAEPVAVLTDGLWQRLFGGSPAAIGQVLHLDGRPHTVVGVLPATFSMPMAATAELWVGSDRGIPRSFPFPGDITTVRDSHFLTVIGRLAADASREVARQELASIMSRLARTFPDTNEGLSAQVMGLHEAIVGDVRPLVLLLQLAVALMLCIGCANVASLLLGQAAGRQAELATRVALGASRGRLVRQLAAETLVIGVPGGLVGLLMAAWGLDALLALAPAELPRLGEVAIDLSVLAFTVIVTFATVAAFGLGPALRSARMSVGAAPQGTRVAGERSVRRWHRVLAVSELALAQVLLVGAALLLGSFVAASRVDLGFVPEGRMAADLSLAPDRYLQPRPDGSANEGVNVGPKLQFVEQVLTRLRSAPRIRAAAASFTAPLSGAPNRGVEVEGRPLPSAAGEPAADFQVITPDYFRALGMTLVTGRAFGDRDTASSMPVAIVNRAFAERLMGGVDPVGEVVIFGANRRHEIVGVVADARYRDVERPADPTFYVPLAQNDERWPFLSFTVWHDDGAGAAVSAAIREALRAADPNQPVSRVRTYDEILAAALAPRRFNTWLVGLFAMTALLLAAVGAYGVLAYGVATRARELGVRAALGASPVELRRLVLRQGLWLGGSAVALGLGGAWLGASAMASLLFEVQPRDPTVFACVAATFLCVALLATWLPARRATRVDPAVALRES